MNKFLMGLLGYMAPADDGEAGGSGGAVDRGDTLEAPKAIDPPPDNGDVSDDSDEEEDLGEDEIKAKDAEAAADDEAADAKIEAAERGRAKDGKFVKAIPKERFDEVLRKGRDREEILQARISELENNTVREVQQLDAQKLETEVNTLEETYQKQLDDGDHAKAKDTMRQIRLKERQIVEITVGQQSERSRIQAVEQMRVDMLLDKLESEFPAIDPKSEEYSQELVDEVVLLRTGFERGGLTSSAAITKAVKYVLGAAAKSEALAPADADADKGIDKGKKDERKQEQLKKNIEAAGKQPPKLDGGIDSNKRGGGIDGRAVVDMNEAEFKALPESTKAKLRGDFVAEVAA